MNCIYHPSLEAKSFCQNCGKPLCQECVRPVGNAIYGPECYLAQPVGSQPGYANPHPIGSQPWVDQEVARAAGNAGYPPIAPVNQHGPHPAAAFWLGFIPGVGAMYNGQFLKALIHVLTFTVLVSMAQEVSVFGFLVAAFQFYQAFEAYQTARARRDGLPLPDPFRINELAARIGRNNQTPPSDPFGPFAPFQANVPPPPPSGAAAAQQQTPATEPGTGYPPCQGYPGYPDYPPIPPVPPVPSGHREPFTAIVLILLGAMFLIGPLTHQFFHFGWPVFLIALGVWLAFKNLSGIQGGHR